MEFESDARKSQANHRKHGIDFAQAQQLWLDDMRVEVGLINGKHWSAVVTYRRQRTRIISVRRSREEEVAIYES